MFVLMFDKFGIGAFHNFPLQTIPPAKKAPKPVSSQAGWRLLGPLRGGLRLRARWGGSGHSVRYRPMADAAPNDSLFGCQKLRTHRNVAQPMGTGAWNLNMQLPNSIWMCIST